MFSFVSYGCSLAGVQCMGWACLMNCNVFLCVLLFLVNLSFRDFIFTQGQTGSRRTEPDGGGAYTWMEMAAIIAMDALNFTPSKSAFFNTHRVPWFHPHLHLDKVNQCSGQLSTKVSCLSVFPIAVRRNPSLESSHNFTDGPLSSGSLSITLGMYTLQRTWTFSCHRICFPMDFVRPVSVSSVW
jgi:hypothetical protein